MFRNGQNIVYIYCLHEMNDWKKYYKTAVPVMVTSQVTEAFHSYFVNNIVNKFIYVYTKHKQ